MLRPKMSTLSPSFVSGVKQLDEISKAVIESHTRLYDTYIQNNRDLSYKDIVMLRARHEKAMAIFGNKQRIKHIFLRGKAWYRLYQFTILDNTNLKSA